MIRISVRNNFPEVAKQMQRMGEQAANRAMAKALNATVEQGKLAMARQISKEYRVTIAQVKYRLQLRKASVSGRSLRFEAVLSASNRNMQGRSMNLIWFAERSITLAQARKRMKAGEGGMYALRAGVNVQKGLQIRFQVKHGGGKKVIPGAFIGNKGRTMFIRTGKARLPIKALNTIDVPQMFNTRRINQIVRQLMLDRFAINFKREARAITKGFAR